MSIFEQILQILDNEYFVVIRGHQVLYFHRSLCSNISSYSILLLYINVSIIKIEYIFTL